MTQKHPAGRRPTNNAVDSLSSNYTNSGIASPQEAEGTLVSAVSDVGQQTNLLRVAAQTNRELLTNPDFHQAIVTVLRILGERTAVDRVYIFENILNTENGQRLTNQRYEWAREGISQEIDNPDLQNVPYAGGLAHWEEPLCKGRSIKEIVETIQADDVREMLAAQGILSIMVVPITISEEFWGFIGFDDCTNKRVWSEDEEMVLQTVAAGMGSAIAKERTQKQLAESDAKYKSVVQNIDEVIFQISSDGTCLFVNDAWNRITGHQPHEHCLGKNFFNFLGEETHEHLQAVCKEILNGEKKRFHHSCHIKTSNGDPCWMDITLMPQINDAGKIIGLFGSMMDSTKQKQALDTLTNSEKRYRQISQLISDYAYRLIPLDNGEFKFEWLLTGGFYNNLGYMPQEIHNLGWIDFVHHDDLHLLQKRAACLRRGEPVTTQFRMETKQGEIIWLEEAASPFIDEVTGKIEEVLCVVSDITLRKYAEKEIQQAHDNLKVIMKSAPFGVIVVGKDRKIRWTNEIMKHMAGIDATKNLTGIECRERFCDEEISHCPVFMIGERVHTSSEEVHMLKTVNEIEFEGEDVYLETFVDITELKKTQKALEENQARFAIAADSAGIGVWELDLITYEMLWDDWMFKLYQQSKDTFKGHLNDWVKCLAPNEYERLNPLIHATIKSEVKNDFETSFLIVTPSGEKRVIKAYGRVVKDESGSPVRLTGINYDITDRQRTEERIRKSQEKYKAIFNTIQDVYAEVALDGTILEISPSIKKISGYSRLELLGENISRFYASPTDKEALQQAIMKYKQLNDYEVQFRHLSGSVRTCSFTVSLIFDDSGKPIKTVGSMRDITDRKKAEQRIRKSQEKYKAIFNAIQDVYAETSLDGVILEITPSIESLVGIPREKLLGQNVTMLYKDPSCREKMLKTLKEKGFLREYEVVLVHRDGSSRTGAFIASLQYNEHGKPCKLISSMRDVTERKKHEQEIVEKEKRYRLLAGDLQKANRELKDFAYIVSHDLKAPLRAIGSLSSWLYSDYADRLDEDGKETLELLVGRVKRMHDLIEGILQYSRIGRIKEAHVDIQLDPLIDEIVDFLAIPEHISVVKETSLPCLTAEKTRVMQVFQNLISNAVKYNDKAKGEIKIGHLEADASWQCYVKDNGPGIDKKYHEKVFQIFQTLSPRDEHESTGIGLTIVKKIIEMYGGTVWLESTLGEGTTFWIELPKSLNLSK